MTDQQKLELIELSRVNLIASLLNLTGVQVDVDLNIHHIDHQNTDNLIHAATDLGWKSDLLLHDPTDPDDAPDFWVAQTRGPHGRTAVFYTPSREILP